MRVTNKQITNTFINNFNKGLENLNRLSLRAASGQKYQKGSEDPVSSLKSMIVKKDLARNSMFQSNIGDVNSILSEVEAGVKQTSSILTDALEKVLQGKSDTYEADRGIIAQTLKNYQSEILDISNTKFTDKYIFGGNSSNELPFTFDASGNLLYHGIDVNTTADFKDEPIYYDIGLGFKADSAGNIIEGTAFNLSNPGSELMGTGVDLNGLPNNIYNLIGDIAKKFENNDMTDMSIYAEKLEDLKEEMLVKYTNVGQKSSFVAFLEKRHESTETNLFEKQNGIEGVDSARAIIEFNSQRDAYNAALQMGSNILQMSLLDYMR